MLSLLCILLFFIMLEIPVSLSIGLASLCYLAIEGFPTVLLAQRSVLGVYSFPFLALPFFVLAGNLMSYGGISRRLLRLASALMGHLRGGLAIVTVFASLLFGALSGSAIGATAAIGSVMIPAMKKKGYAPEFAAALQGTSGVLASLIPPSLTVVVIGATAGLSIGALLVAGVLPGILTALALIIVSLVYSIKNGYGGEARASAKELSSAVFGAILPLLAPIIILGGVWAGICTVTESAVVVVAYSLVLGMGVYKEIKFRDLVPIAYKTAMTSVSIMLIVGFAALFGWIVAAEQMPQAMASWFLSISNSKWVFLLLVNIMVMILGTFMETNAIVLILTPVFFPIAQQYGINLIHFATIFLLNLCIGANTPPLGVTLMTATKIADVSFTKSSRAVIPFLLGTIASLVLVTLVPEFSTYIPKLLFNI